MQQIRVNQVYCNLLKLMSTSNCKTVIVQCTCLNFVGEWSEYEISLGQISVYSKINLCFINDMDCTYPEINKDVNMGRRIITLLGGIFLIQL